MATIDVALQLPMVVAVVPLNFTVLVPWVEPKLVPVIVTDAPTAPDVGDKLVILGAAAKEADDRNRHIRTTTKKAPRVLHHDMILISKFIRYLDLDRQRNER